jgi:hypothetical protein
MAKHMMYTMYDRVAEEYGPPWTARNDAVAVRQFMSGMKENPFTDDFWLYCIGSYDSNSGQLESTPHKRVSLSVKDHIEDTPA